jgi:uncharacterized membrane protein
MAPARSFSVERIFLAAAFVALASPPSHADLQLCNRTSFAAEAALGVDSGGTNATRGWFRVDPGQCRLVLHGKIEADRLYVHARALAVYGPVKPLNDAQVELCVGEGDFLIAGARCKSAGEKIVPFAEVRPRDVDGTPTVSLAEPADYAADQARLAAVQRLLALAGYGIEPIDGLAGPRTDTALAAFLRERGLAPDAAASPAFLDLLIDAVRENASRGLLWCNETTHTVMAALGVDEANAVATRGWWRITPGACVRPDLPQRGVRQVYSFAEAIDENGAPIEKEGRTLNWGGGAEFCTRGTKFEIREHGRCEARGLSARGFAVIEISSHAGTTIRFRETGR